jgi:RNA polymerase sigma-70 factor (ECF subfamily)
MADDFGDEAHLVQRLATGDRAAFEHLYRTHNGALMRVCVGIVGSRAIAEETVQETWISILGRRLITT